MKNLCRTIIWAACFLELSEDDVIEPHAAVKALEDIATALLDASNEEKESFIETCKDEANRLSEQSAEAKVSEFIRSLPYALGLIEEDETRA